MWKDGVLGQQENKNYFSRVQTKLLRVDRLGGYRIYTDRHDIVDIMMETEDISHGRGQCPMSVWLSVWYQVNILCDLVSRMWAQCVRYIFVVYSWSVRGERGERGYHTQLATSSQQSTVSSKAGNTSSLLTAQHLSRAPNYQYSQLKPRTPCAIYDESWWWQRNQVTVLRTSPDTVRVSSSLSPVT